MARFPGLPKTWRGRLLTIGGGFIALVVAGVALVYFLFFPTSSPKPFALTPTTTPTAAATGRATQLPGRWKVSRGSQAGYRVREKLSFLPAQSDAVGRTSAIKGAATITGSKKVVKVTAAAFTVDVSQLKSDQTMRDQRIHTIGLQSDTYPTVTFHLSTPIQVGADLLKGQVVHVSATGVFNIHGVSRRMTVPLQLRLSKSVLEAVGSITFPWSKFNMTAPSLGGFVSVTDKATMEFDLKLRRG